MWWFVWLGLLEQVVAAVVALLPVLEGAALAHLPVLARAHPRLALQSLVPAAPQEGAVSAAPCLRLHERGGRLAHLSLRNHLGAGSPTRPSSCRSLRFARCFSSSRCFSSAASAIFPSSIARRSGRSVESVGAGSPPPPSAKAQGRWFRPIAKSVKLYCRAESSGRALPLHSAAAVDGLPLSSVAALRPSLQLCRLPQRGGVGVAYARGV